MSFILNKGTLTFPWQPLQFNTVQSLSHARLLVNAWTTAWQASLSITNSRSLLKLIPLESVIASNHPLLLPSPLAFNLSQYQGLLQWVSSLHYGQNIGASASAVALHVYSGQIFFRIDSFILLAIQGTLKSLLQHHSSKESILQHSAFFTVQLSHPYM